MPDLYIPPKEISFRLKNKSTNKVLFSRKQSPTFGQFDGETFADQYWQLVPGTGEWKGQYLVKSMVTGKILFSRTQRSPPVDHIDSDGRWADQWFKPEPGTGDRETWFRLHNTSSNTVVFSDKGGIGNTEADRSETDSMFWCFEFEDMKFVSIDYKKDENKILSSVPEAIGSESLANPDASADQSTNIIITQTKTTTSIHEQTHGFTVKGSYSVKMGMPVPAVGPESTFSIEISQNNEWKTGEHVANTKTFAVTVPIVAKHGERIIATVTATKSELEVPWVAVFKSVKTGYEVKSEGIYKGTSFWNVDTVIKRDPLYKPGAAGENRYLEDEDTTQEEHVQADVQITDEWGPAQGGQQGQAGETRVLQSGRYEQGGSHGQQAYVQSSGYGQDPQYTQNEGYERQNNYEQRSQYEDEQTISNQQQYQGDRYYSQNANYEQRGSSYNAEDNNERSQSYGVNAGYGQPGTSGRGEDYGQQNYTQSDNYANNQNSRLNDSFAQIQISGQNDDDYSQSQDYEKKDNYAQDNSCGRNDRYGQNDGYAQNNTYGQNENYEQNNTCARTDNYLNNNNYGRTDDYTQSGNYAQTQGYSQGDAPRIDERPSYNQQPAQDYGRTQEYENTNNPRSGSYGGEQRGYGTYGGDQNWQQQGANQCGS